MEKSDGYTVLHMAKFFLWLLGALMLVALFVALALTGVLGGNAAFIIGWLTVGVYALVFFCETGGEPENVEGTSLFIVFFGLLSLIGVMVLVAYESKMHSATKLTRSKTALHLLQRRR